MKNKIAATIIVLILLGFMPVRLAAHVTLDYPVGGEIFTAGESITIEWHQDVPHDTENFDLHYSIDGGNTWQVLQENISISQEEFQWTVINEPTTQAQIQVTQDNNGFDYTDNSGNFTIQASSTDITFGQAPPEFTLHANYPNPFNPSTTISYSLTADALVTLAIYDIAGARVRTLVQREQSAGLHSVTWNGISDQNVLVESGLYIYRMQTPEKSQTQKMTLIR